MFKLFRHHTEDDAVTIVNDDGQFVVAYDGSKYGVYRVTNQTRFPAFDKFEELARFENYNDAINSLRPH